MMRNIIARQTLTQKRGNALFLVLLGVALFAALSYTITRSSDTMSGDISDHHAGLLADEILLYAKQLERSVQMILANGYSEQDISFKHDDLAAAYDHGGPTGAEVFNISGGGMRYKPFPQASSEGWLFTGSNYIPNIGGLNEFGSISSCSDSAIDTVRCLDLIAILQNIPLNLCLAINKKVGVANIDDGQSPPQDDKKSSFTPFPGQFGAGSIRNLADTNAAGFHLSGKKTGCFEGDEDDDGTDISGQYYFYHVLLAR